MSKPRRKPPARKESRGRTYTISCTDEQWAAIQDGAERAGKNVSTWFVECALTVDPWPRKHRRLVLNEREQRRHARAVAASARNLGAGEAVVSMRASGLSSSMRRVPPSRAASSGFVLTFPIRQRPAPSPEGGPGLPACDAPAPLRSGNVDSPA